MDAELLAERGGGALDGIGGALEGVEEEERDCSTTPELDDVDDDGPG